MGPEVFQPHVSFPVSLLVIRRLAFYSGHASVAVFDVVKSAQRTSPFVLLQPRLRLQDIFPRQRDYPNDETAFVGLVPETGSLYALGPDHFPLVAFGEPAPTQRVESIEGTSKDGVPVSREHGRVQCYDGSTDRQCLTGVRSLVADSRSRLARLLDGVPGPAAPSLPATTGAHARPGNTNSQEYAGDTPVVVLGEGNDPVVPWEWLANFPEAMAPRRSSWIPSSSALLLTLVSIIASLMWFKGSASREKRNATVPDEADHRKALARKAVSIPPLELTENAPHIDPPESQTVHTRAGTKTTLAENSVPVPIESVPTTLESSTIAPVTTPDTPTAEDGAKSSPVKAEGAEDTGEVKKKHRKRRRKRKGETKDASAEEPENEDGEGGEDGNIVSPGTASLFPPPTPAPSASLSLVVSDVVLGMILVGLVPRTSY